LLQILPAEATAESLGQVSSQTRKQLCSVSCSACPALLKLDNSPAYLPISFGHEKIDVSRRRMARGFQQRHYLRMHIGIVIG